MPGYPWLYGKSLDTRHTEGKIITLRRLGVPYPEGFERDAVAHLTAQATGIATRLRDGGLDVGDNDEIIAVIAYLQRLGTDATRPAGPESARNVPGGE